MSTPKESKQSNICPIQNSSEPSSSTEPAQENPETSKSSKLSIFPNPSEMTISSLEKPKTDLLNYEIKILSNGLKALLISDPETTKSSAALGVNIGNISDPPEYEGLAHFCEHLLFLGTEKYPVESEYKKYLSKNGGSSNAFTSDDKTVYYFEVSNEGFDEALDRFCSFFICPLFNESAVEREVNAVDSEFNKNLNNDTWRLKMLRKSETIKESMFNKFSTGNKKTLMKNGIRDVLIEMYKKYYSSEIMNLCVYSNKTIKELSDQVTEKFGLIKKINNFKLPKYNEIMPYQEKINLSLFYQVLPIKDLDELQFRWYLPYNSNYKAKPIDCIDSLFSHEGPNTLASLLKKNNFIFSLTSSCKGIAKTYYEFFLTIKLTKKGINSYLDVIMLILRYIKEIQNQEIDENYFKQYIEIKKLKFDYQNKKKPVEYTKKYVEDLMYYEPVDILTGSSLVKEYNKELIKKYLDLLSLDNLNIFLISKSIKKNCNLQEKWYGTKYSKNKISDIFLKEEEIYCKNINLDIPCKMGYPPNNEFFPKNLELLPIIEKGKEFPEKIIEQENCSVWYLQDKIFRLPKAKIEVQMKLRKNLCGNSKIKNHIISKVLTNIIKQEINEILYMTKIANLEIEFKIGIKNFSFNASGFNSSMVNGLAVVINTIKNININEIKNIQEKIDLVIKNLKKEVFNTQLERSDKVAKEYLDILIKNDTLTIEDVSDFLTRIEKGEIAITKNDLINYLNSLFTYTKSQWLIQGNLTKEESISIVSQVNKILNIDKVINNKYPSFIEFFTDRVIQLKPNHDYAYFINSLNDKEKDSAIYFMFQCGILDINQTINLFLLHDFLKEKFFTKLRTKEALGYLVSLSKDNTLDIHSLIGKIQSGQKCSEFCWQRIKNFFKEQEINVRGISDDEFKKFVESRIVIERKKDNNLSEQFSRNWKEICSGRLWFDIKEKNIEVLLKCKKEDFIKFYEEYFMKNISIIEVQLIAKNHREENKKLIEGNIIGNNEGLMKRVFINTIEEFRENNNVFPNIYNDLFKEINGVL